MAALLETTDLSVRYGGVVANDSVNLKVEKGTIVGLIGPNGAGKTSYIDAVSGFTPCSGQVLLDGSPVGHLKPHLRARRGMTRTFQSLELFEDLSIEENLLVSEQTQPWWAAWRDLVGIGMRKRSNNVDAALAAVGLEGIGQRMPTELSHGQRKLISVARAIAAAPKVVLLDEPAAGLDSVESFTLGERLRSLLTTGLSALLVDHDMGLVLSVCDYIYVLDFGKIIAEGVPADIRRNPRVLEAYLGEQERTRQEDEGLIETAVSPGQLEPNSQRPRTGLGPRTSRVP